MDARFGRMKRFADRWYAALLLCLLFALVLQFRYVFPLNAIPFTTGILGQDCGQMIWNLWVVTEALVHGHNPYVTSLIYFPDGANLGFHSLAPGFFPITLLVKVVSGGDLMYPVYAYRLIILLSFTLILYFSYSLLRRLGYSRWASAIPATAYTFCDFYLEHSIHLNHLAGFFIPLTALCIVRLSEKPNTARAVTASIVAASSIYFTEFSVFIWLALGIAAAAASARKVERGALMASARSLGAKGLVFAVASFLLILGPYLYNVHGLQVLKPKPFEASLYSANLAGFVIPDSAQTPLYGHIFDALRSKITAGMGEPGIFVGFPLLLFGAIGFLTVKRRFLLVATVGMIAFFVLSLGPTLKIFWVDSDWPLPYALLSRIPPFDIGRTPVRFVALGMFFLMILAAAGLQWLQIRLRARSGKSATALFMLLVFGWTVAEVYSPVARARSFEIPRQLVTKVQGPVLNLPLMRNDGYSALLQVFHHQPIATGYLARYTERQWQQYSRLERLIFKGGAVFCDGITSDGIRTVIIDPETIAPDAPSTAPLDLDRCGVQVIDLRTNTGSVGITGENRSADPLSYPPYRMGTRIDMLSAESDPYLWYGWSKPEPGIRWSNSGRAALVFSLLQPQPATLRIELQPFMVPGKIDLQRIEVSLNGQQLATLRVTEPGHRIYSIGLPVLQADNVLTLRFPDSESPAAMGLSEDPRLLAINTSWIEILPAGGR
jgi:hypothetical protein